MPDKSTIDRRTLEQHGIIFSENVYSPNSNKLNGTDKVRVPEYVEHLREALLDNEIQVPDSLQSLFEKERRQQSPDALNADYTLFPPQSVFFPLPDNLVQTMGRDIKAKEDKFEQVAKVAQIAREYAAAKVSQQTWELFLRSYIFRNFDDSAMQTPKYSKLFDAWSLEQTGPWKAVPKLDKISEDAPQPTFTYGFPVHTHNTDKTPTGFNRNECITNFSPKTLGDLTQITSCPTIHPSTLKTRLAEGQKLERSDLICFPWALVEVQSTTEPAERCYCRAASEVHTALKILKNLHQHAGAETNVPPVITFTCCGPEVRVWLSFTEFKIQKPLTRDICIWAGTLTATWCIVTLREIVQNLEFWATRVLKPQISSYISQIRSTASSRPFPPDTMLSRKASQGIQTSETPDISKTENAVGSVTQSGLCSSKQKAIAFATVKIRKAISVPFRGKRIIVRLPRHDERKPFRVKAKAKNKADSELSTEDNTLNSGSDKPEAPKKTKKSLMLNAETQGTDPDPSYTPENKSMDVSKSGLDDGDDPFSSYFVYRTLESFHGRGYDAAIWDTDDDDDESYVPSAWGSESDLEGSKDLSLEEDNADDEASESEQLFSTRKTHPERAESPSPSFYAPPGQAIKLTSADIGDLLYSAANVISGEKFIQLKPIQDLLENLNGMDLLDAAWRSLEAWEGLNPNLYSFQMRCLLEIVKHLDNFLPPQIDPLIGNFKHHHLTMALRRVELDLTLQEMLLKGEYNVRNLIKLSLKAWDGETCMEILSNELLALSPEEFENMLQEALDVASSDWNLLGTV